jgi:hypothetical protein
MGNRFKFYDAKISNEKQWPAKYTRKFIEQGLVSYAEMGLDNLLLRKETIDNLVPSFIGKPVIIKHEEVDPGNFLDLAVGYITDIYFNAVDGWYYVDFLITHDKGHEKISDGWGVSCSYKVNQLISGGDYHNIPYTQEIVSGVGEHLALVANPRYEDCLDQVGSGTPMMVNDKPAYLYNEKTYLEKHKPEDNEMAFKIIGKKDEHKGFSLDSVLQLANGVKVKIADLIKLHNATVAEEVGEEEEITLPNGKTAKLIDLVNTWKAANGDTDEGEEKDEKDEEGKDEGKSRDKSIKNKKLKNCGCGAKDGKHGDDCTMYNSDGTEKDPEAQAIAQGDKLKNELALVNEKLEALQLENEALRTGAANLGAFVKISNAGKQKTNEDAVLLENGTPHSGSMEAGLARGKALFGSK